MLTSTDFSGLLTERFFKNFLPIPATSPLVMGAKTPDFALTDVNGDRPVRLSDYVGDPAAAGAWNRPIVLAFTRIFTEKQYCPLCFPHIKAMNAAYEDFQQRGVEVLMITSTDAQQSKTVVRDLGLKMPLLSDPSCRTFQAYQVGQALGAPLPAQFVLDAEGKLQFRHLFSFLEPNASVERLLAVVDDLQAGTV